MSNYTLPPMQIRASIGADEWVSIRQQAIREQRPVHELIADAIRATYPQNESEARSA